MMFALHSKISFHILVFALHGVTRLQSMVHHRKYHFFAVDRDHRLNVTQNVS